MSDDAGFPMTGDGDIKISYSFVRSLQECEELCRSLCIEESCGQMMKTREDELKVFLLEIRGKHLLPTEVDGRRTCFSDSLYFFEVRNIAGGFVLAVSDETTIRRFIILGSSGGTYYSRKKQLTMDNVKALIDIIERGRGSLILKEVYEVSRAGRNPKQDPLLLALAVCARYNVCDSISKLSGNKEALERGDVAAAKLKYLHELHKSALEIVNEVCRIPSHLFTFVKYCEMVSQSAQSESGKKSTGWGRLMRSAIQRWLDFFTYASKTPGQLAMHLTKYPQRDGWSHRDLFRLAHPTLKVSNFPTTILEYEQLFHFAARGKLKTRKRNLSKEDADVEQPAAKYSAVQMDTELKSRFAFSTTLFGWLMTPSNNVFHFTCLLCRALDLVEAVMALKNEKDEAKVVAAIKKHREFSMSFKSVPLIHWLLIGLVRQHIPTDMLNSVAVWQALLERMPMTAMIRNLGKMQSIGEWSIRLVCALFLLTNCLFYFFSSFRASVVARLTNEEELKRARIHPIHVLMAKAAYESVHGGIRELSWKANEEISEALEVAFYKSFINAPPTNKRYCFAFGRLWNSISGTLLSCQYASVALSLVSLKNEKIVECVGFSDDLIQLPYNREWTISRIMEHMDGFDYGATDCALPMLWAKENNKKFDVFVVYTDNEIWFDDVHPYQALRDYRESSGIVDAKLVVMGMTATDFTIADPEDAGMLDIVGFDSAVPTLLRDFVTGKI
ncbi:unnamed protein product [Angiostrongylus costaricensis]|uniref:TROVE domain-containing protein n=1 Tax=Angiostrongylus costaricensis TaxID=334426 RepID=A0A0R3PD93_ANGCS|nr:unnamed protein product [Angiostrongylus costaricensis]